jgi:diguanylate cyclase (GGDEF)-like protein/PAS domain S-box-containing protein
MRGAAPATVQNEWDATEWAVAQVRASASPAFVVRGDGSLVSSNAAAEPLCGRGELPSSLRTLVIDARLKDCAQAVKVAVPDRAGGASRCFDLAIVPVPVGQVFVIGREITLETNVMSALAASRDLFRDLALCFTDFAFETDATGVFSWVSPAGLLGYDAAELHGAQPVQVFGGLEAVPFTTRERLCAREIWLTSKAGEEACLEVTASPIVDAQGQWRGVRGVARDVTKLRLHEREAAHAKKREDLIDAVIDAVRAQVEPRRMMLAAADALAAATDSDAVVIRAFASDLSVGVGENARGLSHAREVATSYQGKPNGCVRLSREASKGAYGELERSLVDAIVPHLGVALALAQTLDTGAVLRRDVVTGLLNRRTFLSEANKKLSAAARAGRGLTLFVFDCDHLEEISQLPGAATGEEFLAEVGRSLAQACREGELSGRLDEESFAVLTDALPDPMLRAAGLCADLIGVARTLGVHNEVGISAGCAVGEPEDGETLEDLFGRAECALHAAKREGRNRVVLAQPLQKVTSCSNG